MKLMYLALALFALCLLPATSARAQAVIEFPKGSGTETREEVLGRGAVGFDYQLKAKPGQTVIIKLEPVPAQGASLILSYETEGDQPVVLTRNAVIWTGKLPQTGLEDRHGIATYDISVNPRARRPRGEIRFKLTVTVK